MGGTVLKYVTIVLGVTAFGMILANATAFNQSVRALSDAQVDLIKALQGRT